jgi:hypothetical protein
MNSTYCLIFLMKPSRTMTQTLCLTLSARISYRTNRTVHNEYSAAARACETYLRRASRCVAASGNYMLYGQWRTSLQPVINKAYALHLHSTRLGLHTRRCSWVPRPPASVARGGARSREDPNRSPTKGKHDGKRRTHLECTVASLCQQVAGVLSFQVTTSSPTVHQSKTAAPALPRP